MTGEEAAEIALEFLMTDWAIPSEDWEWFTVLNSRYIKNSWFVVEIGIEGLPDKWVLQVYEHGECDPNYTFNSPIKSGAETTGLEEYPQSVADTIAKERNGGIVSVN
ncbi:hypothetical protein [Floridanema evergladense]|uniref:Phage ABA sandwich domain-containing protein n=1 Tax=Floridaenema evergladense BLCC-F167 TaxID=3153639 RepID=A0ABV4WL69_9CYAN